MIDRAVDQLEKTETPGRNDLCDCGSDKKYKKCCGAEAEKTLTLRDMVSCLYLLLDGARQENLAFPKGPIPFSRKMLDEVPDKLLDEILVAESAQFIVLTTKPKKDESIIYTGPRVVR